MQDKLKIVASNPDIAEKIIAAIRPLDREVAPSKGFRERTKLLLLSLATTDQPGSARAAA